ncbi:hypothetical protein Tco_0424089 [Tanacetum coccineum]
MGTKVTSSSGSVLEEPEIQKLQMQAKNLKENSLNKLNALKSTTQLLERQTFSGPVPQCSNDVCSHQFRPRFERFINSDLLKPLDIYSRSFSSDREVIETFRDYTKMTAQTFKETIIQNMNSIEQCIIERASHEQELKMTLKKLSERQLQIQQCKVQEVQSSVTSLGDETSSGIVSDEEIEKKFMGKHITVFSLAKIRMSYQLNQVLLIRHWNREQMKKNKFAKNLLQMYTESRENYIMKIHDLKAQMQDKNIVQASVVNDKWCLLKITLQAPFLNVKMTSVHISSGLVLHQMTSDHNRSELGIQDHSNEPSSSKLVHKVVP